MNGESGGAFALASKLLHPRPKAMGVEQQSAVFETGRNFRFLALAPSGSLTPKWVPLDESPRFSCHKLLASGALVLHWARPSGGTKILDTDFVVGMIVYGYCSAQISFISKTKPPSIGSPET